MERFKKISNWLWEILPTFKKEMRVAARVYASEELLKDILKDESINQLINSTTLPGIEKYAIAMPDCHEGYSVPIGFVGAIRADNGVISPGACGFDINCGMRLLKSEYTFKELFPSLDKLSSEIQAQIPSGLGQGGRTSLFKEKVNNILEQGAQYLFKQGYGVEQDVVNCESQGRLSWADISSVSEKAKNRGKDQVGTLGSGNHFLEIQKVEEIFDSESASVLGLFKNQIVVMIHCGSRGLGHQICTDYLKEFIPLMNNRYKIKVPDQEFACVPFNSFHGQKYFQAMACAANYAWANRQMITYLIRKTWQRVLGEKNSSLIALYDVAHNIIKKEEYTIGEKEIELLVHRKGATRAFPPENPEIPEKYRKIGQPVLIPGSMGTASYVLTGKKEAEQSFYSVSHGAGRVMSRHEARRKFDGRKIILDLKQKGILVKCRSQIGIVEEAPFVYKNIDQVVNVIEKANLAKKIIKLVPLAIIKGE
ncbi:MAG: RtcB family protein [Candidatus Pacebacteria bacterium]|nr:RtcB family protein [Candidatus Paceibacterota bacterium]